MCFAWLSQLFPGLFFAGGADSSSTSAGSTAASSEGKTLAPNLADLVRDLVTAAERAATIARSCRAEETLFKLLVEEKTEDANTRFVQDFKTLADVLIQETVRYYLATKYPEVAEHLFGEESPTFTNSTGDSVTVTVKGNKKRTRDSLEMVLGCTPDALAAAQLLTDYVYDPNFKAQIPDEQKLASGVVPFSPSDLAIWIDPIDGTNEYVKGETPSVNADGIFPGGLPVVTVLIGAYNRHTGEPIAGVVSQPFWKRDESAVHGWQGRTVWGFSKDGVRASSSLPTLAPQVGKTSLVVMSSSEGKELKEAAAQKFSKLEYPAGAGYKLLTVIEGAAEGYILSKPSTYKWDTCGPHAILLAKGGNLLTPDGGPVRYHQPDDSSLKGQKKWSNSKGFVAYAPHLQSTDLTSLWKS